MGTTAYQFDFTSAGALPENIKFGTSSWNYPGWQGIVYQQPYKDEKALRKDALSEYVRFPWFRTVGIDSSFYAPPAVSTLSRYKQQVPADFRWAAKVWERISVPQFGTHPRYGALAGKENPDFLSPKLFNEQFLHPFRESQTTAHCEVFILQFQAFPQKTVEQPEWFYAALEKFFSGIPQDFRFATELRNRELISHDYLSILNKHRHTHCFNHWDAMPPLIEQMKLIAACGGINHPLYVARLLTPLGMRYQQAVKKFSPYNRLVAANPRMRADTVRLAKRAVERGAQAYILVNNRSEGNAPITINEIGKSIVAEL